VYHAKKTAYKNYIR
jgi:hypothetical protein